MNNKTGALIFILMFNLTVIIMVYGMMDTAQLERDYNSQYSNCLQFQKDYNNPYLDCSSYKNQSSQQYIHTQQMNYRNEIIFAMIINSVIVLALLWYDYKKKKNPIIIEKDLECVHCGFEVDSDSKYCENCGLETSQKEDFFGSKKFFKVQEELQKKDFKELANSLHSLTYPTCQTKIEPRTVLSIYYTTEFIDKLERRYDRLLEEKVDLEITLKRLREILNRNEEK